MIVRDRCYLWAKKDPETGVILHQGEPEIEIYKHAGHIKYLYFLYVGGRYSKLQYSKFMVEKIGEGCNDFIKEFSLGGEYIAYYGSTPLHTVAQWIDRPEIITLQDVFRDVERMLRIH